MLRALYKQINKCELCRVSIFGISGPQGRDRREKAEIRSHGIVVPQDVEDAVPLCICVFLFFQAGCENIKAYKDVG